MKNNHASSEHEPQQDPDAQRKQVGETEPPAEADSDAELKLEELSAAGGDQVLHPTGTVRPVFEAFEPATSRPAVNCIPMPTIAAPLAPSSPSAKDMLSDAIVEKQKEAQHLDEEEKRLVEHINTTINSKILNIQAAIMQTKAVKGSPDLISSLQSQRAKFERQLVNTDSCPH